MVVLHGLMLATIGVAIGLAAAMAVTRVLSTMLFEVRLLDPLTYGLVSVGLLLAAVVASYIPGYRASAMNPVEALRAE